MKPIKKHSALCGRPRYVVWLGWMIPLILFAGVVRAENIVLGMSAAFSGTSRGLGIELYRSSMAYLEPINQGGGIGGRKIVIRAYDDGYNPTPVIQNTIRLVENDDVFLLFGGQISYSNGGHNPPYLFSRKGNITPLQKTRGRVLGINPDAEFEHGTVILRPGDGILLYTDGVTEATDGAYNLFSETRLEQYLDTVNSASAKELIEELVNEIRKFSVGVPQSDDITILALLGAIECLTIRSLLS